MTTWILTMFLIGGAWGLLLRVDITRPQNSGRQEIEDISIIDKTLSETDGVNVHFKWKFFDNQKVLLVLEISDTCGWNSFSSTLSTKGFLVSTTPLRPCEETVKELDTTVKYNPSSDLQSYDKMHFFEVTYYDQGRTTDDYQAMLKKHFERDMALIMADKALKCTCYQSDGRLPVTLIYFTVATSQEMKTVYAKERQEGKASITLDMVQSFSDYTRKC